MSPRAGLRICTFSRDRGFTIVEVVIVLLVVAVLSAIAIPAYNQWSQNTEYRESAKNIFYILRETRSRAITTNLEHRIEFESSNRRYRVTRGDRSSNSIRWDMVVFDWIALPPSVNMNTNTGMIHMNTNGTANGGTIKIQDHMNATKYEVRIARTGRIRIPWLL